MTRPARLEGSTVVAGAWSCLSVFEVDDRADGVGLVVDDVAGIEVDAGASASTAVVAWSVFVPAKP